MHRSSRWESPFTNRPTWRQRVVRTRAVVAELLLTKGFLPRFVRAGRRFEVGGAGCRIRGAVDGWRVVT